MTNYFKLYWLTRLDSIIDIFTFLMCIGIAGLICIVLYRLYKLLEEDDVEKKPWRVFTYILFFSIGLLGRSFTPTKEEAIFIVAGGKVMDFTQKDSSLNKIPGQATTILSTWMDKELNKLKNNVDSTKNNK